MKKILIVIAVLALAGGGIYYYQKNVRQAQEPAEQAVNAQNSEPDPSANEGEDKAVPDSQSDEVSAPVNALAPQPQTTKPSSGTFSSGEEGEGASPDIQVWQIVYDGSGFEPSVIHIKVGDVVIFKNRGDSAFWPASDPHPAHTAYPEFDAQKSIAAGSKFQFQFTKIGSFGFHDHLNPSAKGTVNVTD